jgi:hypothetical protein
MAHCKQENIVYPLRALTEFFHEEQTEKSLSKLLNSESYLQYKMAKQI